MSIRIREAYHTESFGPCMAALKMGQDQAFWGYLVALSLPAFPMSQSALFLLASDAQSIYSIKSQPLLFIFGAGVVERWSMGPGMALQIVLFPALWHVILCQAPVPDTSNQFDAQSTTNNRCTQTAQRFT